MKTLLFFFYDVLASDQRTLICGIFFQHYKTLRKARSGMPAVVYFKNFEFFSLMKDIKLLHQRVFLPDLFCFVFSTLRGLVLTLPSMPSR